MRVRRIVPLAAGALLASLLWGPGCFRKAARPPEPPPRAATAPAETAEPVEGTAPAAPAPPSPETAGAPRPAGDNAAAPVEIPREEGAPKPLAGPPESGPAPETGDAGSRSAAAKPGTAEVPKKPVPSRPDKAGPAAGEATAAVSPIKDVPREAPRWASGAEELVYKVEFLGLTMGYARFTFLGKATLDGKETYRLRVRAWTSDLLSVFYPVDDTIEYYLDPETLAPIRLEFRKSRKEDEVAHYDQTAGTIVYRYRESGKIRKRVEAVPRVYDPVSVAYYFRTRPLAVEEPSRNMYAGRKIYEVSAKPLRHERIRTDRGEFDTVLIEPVLRRNGQVEDKGDLRVWMTRDERHLPVRIYAKFKKVRTWTLVGELLPDPQGG